MALISPGVEVTVIDESFYTPAEPGTTPLIVVATGQDKPNAAGTSTASGTIKANAGRAFRITSQRELVETFGVPFFEKTVTSTPIHGSERNEYGLLAAYSLLGVTNSVFIVRADVDLDELAPQSSEPGAEPNDGQWWVDTAATLFGIFEWNGADAGTTGGQKFAPKAPLIFTDADDTKVDFGTPKGSVGAIGDYAAVVQTAQGGSSSFDISREAITFWYKSSGGTFALGSAVEPGQWVKIGSPEWKASHPTVVGSGSTSNNPTVPAGTIKINGDSITVGAVTKQAFIDAINSLGQTRGYSAKLFNNRVALFTDGEDSSSEDSASIFRGELQVENISGDILDQIGIAANTYLPPALQFSTHTQVPTWKITGTTARPTGSVWVKTTTPNKGADWVIKRWDSDIKVWTRFDAPVYANTHQANYFLDRSSGGLGIPSNSVFVQTNTSEDISSPEADLRIWYRSSTAQTAITSAVIATQFSITGVDEWDDQESYAAGDKVSYIINNVPRYFEALQEMAFPAGVVTPGTVGSSAFWLEITKRFSLREQLVGQLELSATKEIVFAPDATNASTTAERIAAAINGAGFLNVEASVTDFNQIRIVHRAGGDFRISDPSDSVVFGSVFTAYNLAVGSGTPNLYQDPTKSPGKGWFATNWRPLSLVNYKASGTQPLEEPRDGQLWYNPNFGDIDLMAHNGEIWVGISNHPDYQGSEIIVSASEPQLTSSQADVNNHVWISTADLENFPTVYRWSSSNKAWSIVDKTDQTTEDGILFADARYGVSGGTGNTAGSIGELRTKNYVDPDCPDPVLYPANMLLWNTRRSGGNVKVYRNDYINTGENNVRYREADNEAGITPPEGESMAAYATDRWVTISGNNEDGSGSFGRKAQRKVVTQAMKSIVDTSEEIRDEERRNFNIIASPGYPELLSNLINLNIDRGLTAFVIGDTPLRLKSDATTLTTWGTNANLVFDNGDDGIVSYDEYAAVYYPNGFTTDLSGVNAVVPASHMMLRTIALSDQVSYPWFAPAGTRRGGITNATAVGYIDSATGEFRTVALNEGQRDTLYELKVNPIPFFVGVGHVAYGQKTRARNASALDRINVARLVVYLRSQLNKLARPYLFEPNDKITRDEIKGAVESLLLELVGLRALYDFAVVCDESNNTPARIDRNELWVDIAIEPVKAVEFIYIPLRLKNTGEI
jgi:hypothetical protein